MSATDRSTNGAAWPVIRAVLLACPRLWAWTLGPASFAAVWWFASRASGLRDAPYAELGEWVRLAYLAAGILLLLWLVLLAVPATRRVAARFGPGIGDFGAWRRRTMGDVSLLDHRDKRRAWKVARSWRAHAEFAGLTRTRSSRAGSVIIPHIRAMASDPRGLLITVEAAPGVSVLKLEEARLALAACWREGSVSVDRISDSAVRYLIGYRDPLAETRSARVTPPGGWVG